MKKKVWAKLYVHNYIIIELIFLLRYVTHALKSYQELFGVLSKKAKRCGLIATEQATVAVSALSSGRQVFVHYLLIHIHVYSVF